MVGDEERLAGRAGGLAVAVVLAEPREAVDLGPDQVRLLTVAHLKRRKWLSKGRGIQTGSGGWRFLTTCIHFRQFA